VDSNFNPCIDAAYADRCTSIIDNLIANGIWWIGGLILTGVIALIIASWRRPVFIAIPMSALTDSAKFQEYKKFAEDLCHELKAARGITAYCAYNGINDPSGYGKDDKDTVEVYKKIRGCKYFVGIFPELCYPSVLVETSYALARGKQCSLMFTRQDGKASLPYVLEKGNANGRLGHRIRKHEFEMFSDILAAARQNPARFLNPNAK